MRGELPLAEGPVVVSGLPRAGTSMLMRMLEAGGLPLLVDGVRTADYDNPEGYYEFEPVKTLRHCPECLDGAEGKAVKVISRLLYDLPQNRRYRVLFVRRDLEEILASQSRMLARKGMTSDSDECLRETFEKHLMATQEWLLRRPQNFEVLNLQFADVHASPQREADRMNEFLGGEFDAAAMATAVNPSLYRQHAGNSQESHCPQRIVCLAAETPEILDFLGVGDRIVAVSGFCRRPATVLDLPKVGGFANPKIDEVVDLRPDLVITTSDVQSAVAAELIAHGVVVLALNPLRLTDVWRSIHMVGGAIGLEEKARELVATLLSKLKALAETDEGGLGKRPKVYFEEWPEPRISAIGWVADLIDELGGEYVFPELVGRHRADDREVTDAEVARRQPDVIIASWCGRKVDLQEIARRPELQSTPAVRRGHIYELASEDILQAGPSLLRGAAIIKQMMSTGLAR